MSKVLIIDDHPIVLQGCRHLLQVIGVTDIIEASDIVSGYRLYYRHRPDVAIIDLSLNSSGLGGIYLIRRLKRHDQHCRVLVFSMHGDPVIANRAIEAGALGYLVKDTSDQEFLRAFERVRNGSPYMSHDLAMAMAMCSTRDHHNPLSDLTPRQLQILSLLAEAKSYNAIAEELHISYKTVANTCTGIKLKFGVNTLAELVKVAIQYLPPVS